MIDVAFLRRCCVDGDIMQQDTFAAWKALEDQMEVKSGAWDINEAGSGSCIVDLQLWQLV